MIGLLAMASSLSIITDPLNPCCPSSHAAGGHAFMAGPAGPGDGMGPFSTHLRHVVEVHCNESTTLEIFFARPRLSGQFRRCNSGGRNGTAAVWKTRRPSNNPGGFISSQSCNLRKPGFKSSCKIQVSEFRPIPPAPGYLPTRRTATQC